MAITTKRPTDAIVALPFPVVFPEEDIDDLRRRIETTRFRKKRRSPIFRKECSCRPWRRLFGTGSTAMTSGGSKRD